MEDDQKHRLHRKKVEKATRESASLSKMMAEQPLDPKDPHQQTYRQNQSLGPEGSLMSRFGWRVADLASHQEEIVLQCMAILTSDLSFPITSVTHLFERTVEGREETVRSLWIELSLMVSFKSQDFFMLGNSTPQSKLFSFCYQQLLPLLKSFLTKYLNWGSMVSGPHDNAGLLQAFQKQVVQIANSRLQKDNLLSGQE